MIVKNWVSNDFFLQKCILFLLLFCLAPWNFTFAQESKVRIKPFYWLPRLEGKMQITAKGSQKTIFNFNRDLEMGTPDNISSFDDYINRAAGFEIHFLGSTNLNLTMYQTRYSGSIITKRSLTFDSTTFPSGSNLKSKLRMQLFDIDWEFPMMPAPLEINTLIGVKLGYFDIEMRSTTPSTLSQKRTEEAILPYIGVSGRFDFGSLFTIYGKLVALKTELSQDAFSLDGYEYFEGSFGAMVHIGTFALGVEYKAFNFAFKSSNSKSDTEFRIRMGGTNRQPYHGLLFFAEFFF